MSSASYFKLRPFVSIAIITCTLFAIVFFKMEVRRMGYSVWRLSRFERAAADKKRLKVIDYAKLNSPGRIEQIAQKQLALAKPNRGQMVQMNGEIVVLQQ
ncbi:MAG: histidine kinase [Bdellovibrionales bacterium]